MTGFGQPGISRDAIAEYQVVTNLFDVSMGKSVGLEVQAISKSGNNSPSGSFYGYFRDDKLNGADPFAHACCRTRTSRSAARSAARSCATRRTSSPPTSASANPNTINLHPAALAPQNVDVDRQGRQVHRPRTHRPSAVATATTSWCAATTTTGCSRTTSACRRMRVGDRRSEPRRPEGHHVLLRHRQLVARRQRRHAAGAAGRLLPLLLDLRSGRWPGADAGVQLSRD